MKNLLLALSFIGAMSVLTSCSKDYNCECTTTVGGVQTGTQVVVVSGTKSKATDACEKSSVSQTVGGITQTVSCKIK